LLPALVGFFLVNFDAVDDVLVGVFDVVDEDFEGAFIAGYHPKQRGISWIHGSNKWNGNNYFLKNTPTPSRPSFSQYWMRRLWWTHCFAYFDFPSPSAVKAATRSASEAPGT